jgi:FlaA1/EpsC-like NDP-sugar epimerase
MAADIFPIGGSSRSILRHGSLKAAADSAGWVFALFVAVIVRFDFDLSQFSVGGFAICVGVVIVLQVVVGSASGLYVGRWWFGSFEEVAALAGTAVLTTGIATAIDFWFPSATRPLPVSAMIGAGFVALVWMFGIRYAWRLHHEAGVRTQGYDITRVIVFGAGEGGVEVIRAMLRDPNTRYRPVALLDDDPAKRNLRIMGVPVVGGRPALVKTVQRFGPRALLIAIPSADRGLVTDVTRLAEGAGLEVKVLPRVSELLFRTVAVADIRDVTEADLLGRAVVRSDVPAIAGYLSGKRVLVSGAGGSIGTELCRQIKEFSPAELIMADQDGSALHRVQLLIDGKGLLDSPNVVVLDIRDRRRVWELFHECQPEVVFHAAALKHLTLLERYPSSALETNVWGTLNLLDAAAECYVGRFVNISTDKAADPISVLGYSKRLSERLTAHTAAQVDGAYLSVRFGNVLGSRGSMLEAFHGQVAAGGPIRVTHPDVSRYFMTVEEAVQLVIQAGAVGQDGDALVLDMGEPVRIADVARLLAARSSHPVDIVYTGLRPGEKLHEVLVGRTERATNGIHPLISQVSVPPLPPEAVLDLDRFAKPAEIIERLRWACDVHASANRPSMNGSGNASPRAELPWLSIPDSSEAHGPSTERNGGEGRGHRISTSTTEGKSGKTTEG